MFRNVLFSVKSFKIALTTVVSLAFVSHNAFAQGWTKVATFDGLISLVKFVDQSNGFVGLGLSPGRPGFVQPPIEVYRTSDAGNTWRKCTTPTGYSGEIADIVMTDKFNGWLAMTCYGGSGMSALWRTSDGGWTWNATPLTGAGTSVAMTSRAMLVTDLFGPGHLSTDGGTTFTNGFPNSTNCAAFVDDRNGVISDFRGLQWLVTSDGGLTWNPSSMDVEAWSVYGVAGTSKYYSAPEGWTNGTPYPNGIVYESIDYGHTFNSIATFPFRFNGHIAGIGDNLLVFQVIDNDTNIDVTNHGGFYYSTDQGSIWTGIRGPSASNDARFCLLNNCYGAQLYGFDDKSNGTLWRYDFNTPLKSGNALPAFSSLPLHSSVTICRDTLGGFKIFDDYCDSIVILNIKDLDSNSLAVTSGAFGFDSLRPMPFFMTHGIEDSIGFHWNPSGKIAVDTTFTLHLDVHYLSLTTNSKGDTILPITLSATYSGVGYALSASNINMGTASTCTSRDTTITLTNFGCVPIFLDSSTLNGSGFALLDTLTTRIQPGDTAHIRVRFNPVKGSNNGRLTIYVNNQGSHDLLSLNLSGKGIQGLGVLDVRSMMLQAGSLSFCSGDTVLRDTLRNLGCDTLVISDIRFGGDPAFTLLSSPDSLLLPGDSGVFTFQFAPRLKGPHNATLLFNSRNIVNDPGRDISVTIAGVGTSATTALALDSTRCDFGSVLACNEPMLTDTLRNTGCDTLVLSHIRFGGDSAFTLVSTPDSILLPGDSGVFTFQFAPRTKGTHAATLTFHSQNIVNDPGIDTSVTIFGIGLGGTTALSADTTTRDFGALFECESRDTTIWLTNPGCDTLTVESTAFSNPAFSSLTSLPSLLPPDSSIPVIVHLTGNPGSMVGLVTFYTNANTGDSTATVPLQAMRIPPAQLQLTLQPAGVAGSTASGKSGDVETIYIILTGDTGAAASALKGTTFDLTHNDDLLSDTGVSGVSLRRGTALHGIETDTLDWKVGLESPTYADTIGTLSFQVYLTDSSSTPLTLSNISLQGPPDIPMDCIASVDSNASGFTYLYRCSEPLIQQFLRTGTISFHIESVVPNPASATLRVEGRGQGVEMDLRDVLGRQWLPSTLYPLPSTLDVSALPAGVYYLRATQGGYSETRQVAIER